MTPYPRGTILRDQLDREWIVLYHDPWFSEQYGNQWFLLYRRASVISLGDRLPISWLDREPMTPTGEVIDPITDLQFYVTPQSRAASFPSTHPNASNAST